MPTYDYRCGNCGHQFEHFQSMSSNRLRKCPECAERKLERLVGGGSGVIFKGSGFYQTDYKNGSRGKSGSKRSESSSDSESDSSNSSADDKPAKPKSDAGKSESKGKSDGKGNGKGKGSSTKKD